MPGAVEVGEREAVARELVEHARTADEGDGHARRRQAAADETADGARPHHEHFTSWQWLFLHERWGFDRHISWQRLQRLQPP
ncbi:hypothetical protein D9M69_656810 [compost metagenome]